MSVAAPPRNPRIRARAALFDSDSDLDSYITDEINIKPITPEYYAGSHRRHQHLSLPVSPGPDTMYRNRNTHPKPPSAGRRTMTVGTRSIRSSPLQEYHDDISSSPISHPTSDDPSISNSTKVQFSDKKAKRNPWSVQAQHQEPDTAEGAETGPGRRRKGKEVPAREAKNPHEEEEEEKPQLLVKWKELSDRDAADGKWDTQVQQWREGEEEEEMELLVRYPPPAILRQVPKSAPNMKAASSQQNEDDNEGEQQHEIIQQILQSSVDNVIGQVEAKARLEQLRQLELQREAGAAAALQDKGKGRADDGDGDASTSGNNDIPAIQISSEEEGSSSATTPAKESKSSHRSRFGIRRMLNHITDKSLDSPKDRIISPEGSEASKSHEALPMSAEASPTTTTTTNGPEAALDVQQKSHRSSPLHRFIKKHRKAASEGGESSTAAQETMECIACLSDFPIKSLIQTSCHPYCPECFTALITTAINTEAQWPPKCCLNPIPPRTITKALSKTPSSSSSSSSSLLRLYKLKSAEYAIPPADRIYCPHPSGCSLWIQSYDKAAKTARCSKGHKFCIMCRQCPPHKASDPCPQDKDLQLLTEIAEESGWKRCFKCAMLVEHREACAHMRCRCGAQFCYVCGRKWQTCYCNGADLARIKDQAERKRLERLEREAAAADGGGVGSSRDAGRLAGVERDRGRESISEAAWLENAMRLIEAFERGERERLVEQRREEARRREERRRREAEERARREEERIKGLVKRYAKLKWELVVVRNWQQQELVRAQTREMNECRENAIQERDETVQNFEQERLQLRAQTKAKIEEREMKWKKEYSVRVAWEKQLEEEYAQLLTEFWEGKVGGREQAERALNAYMRKNDARRDAWRKTRNSELEMFRYTVEEDLGIAEEFLDRLIQRAGKMAEERQREVDKKHKAEFRWFELADAERNRLVVEMEAVEWENGGEMSDGSMSLTDDDFLRSGDESGSFVDV